MTDDLNRITPEDPKRINVNQDHELEYWSKKLGITKELLVTVVETVGPMVKDVENFLGR